MIFHENKVRKRRLKKWVKYCLNIALLISIAIIFAILVHSQLNNYSKVARQCDREKGYTCSYYEIRQYSLGK